MSSTREEPRREARAAEWRLTGTEIGELRRAGVERRAEEAHAMSARIVVNFSQGLAECAVDRVPDGGTWLSLRQGSELVLVKLSTPSLEALLGALATQLGVVVGGAKAPDAGDGRALTGSSTGMVKMAAPGPGRREPADANGGRP